MAKALVLRDKTPHGLDAYAHAATTLRGRIGHADFAGIKRVFAALIAFRDIRHDDISPRG